ncbi:MAG: CheR family methyltransferase [Ferruginibacter sp.]
MRTKLISKTSQKKSAFKANERNAWQFLEDQSLMKSLAKHLAEIAALNKSLTVRIWIVGCSPCESVYATGIFLFEELLKSELKPRIRIFATDASEANINHARKGFFSEVGMSSVPAKYQQQFFSKLKQNTQLIRSMRDNFIFATHDFLNDTAFGKMDLIICKDQVLKLEPTDQQKLLKTFRAALNPNGILLPGPKEKPAFEPGSFKLLSKRFNFYQKLEMAGRSGDAAAGKKMYKEIPPEILFAASHTQHTPQNMERLLLDQLAPERIVVDNQFNVIEFQGGLNEFLEIPTGRATLRLFKLIRKELFAELHKVLQEMKLSGGGPQQLTVSLNAGELVDINIIPLKNRAERSYVLIFKKKNVTSVSKKISIAELSRVKKLERQLELIRLEMDSITQDYENAANQLQTANEELMSNSEELKSLNEELETSKEELLQINEELVTANQQLYNRNENLIAARKKIEENSAMLRKLYMESPALIATLSGTDHVYDLINPNYQALFGSYPLQGLPLREALPKLQGEEDIISIVNRVFHKGEKIIANELPLLLPNKKRGEILFFNFTFQPIYNAQRIITGVLCFGYEVTELVAVRKFNEGVIERQQLFSDELESQVKERTASLRASNIELEHSNKNLEQFASIASHDLQEPLRKIKTFTSILHTRFAAGFDEEVNSWVKKIGTSAERMSLLITDVLNFSRITQSSSGYVTTDLNKIVNSVISDFDLLISEKKAKVIKGKLPVLEAVPLQMNQLFYNLLGNALKFSDKNRSPRISILANKFTAAQAAEYKDLDPALNYCRITVTDNGIGFDSEFSEQIFQIFERLHNSSSYVGTGIGLALCRKIVFNHRGRISAASNGKKGAIFDVILPLKQPVP